MVYPQFHASLLSNCIKHWIRLQCLQWLDPLDKIKAYLAQWNCEEKGLQEGVHVTCSTLISQPHVACVLFGVPTVREKGGIWKTTTKTTDVLISCWYIKQGSPLKMNQQIISEGIPNIRFKFAEVTLMIYRIRSDQNQDMSECI